MFDSSSNLVTFARFDALKFPIKAQLRLQFFGKDLITPCSAGDGDDSAFSSCRTTGLYNKQTNKAKYTIRSKDHEIKENQQIKTIPQTVIHCRFYFNSQKVLIQD